MKQFNKYGVALAVSAVAGTAVAQVGSDQNLGDAAIVPYYTTLGGKNTGVHIINTTDATQVVKFRLRRATDSKDALDFNIILSPEDEWTGSIQADSASTVKIVTFDTTCTAPAFSNGVAAMPSQYREGAEEGYIEIIGMGQADAGKGGEPISADAVHVDGVPANCDLVRENFNRVSDADAANGFGTGFSWAPVSQNSTADVTAAGVHNSAQTSNGEDNDTATNSSVSTFDDTDDRALKVSWFIRDADGGLEVGGNAAHIEGFGDAPMMSNQVALSFNAAGNLLYDPFNFELPNLNQGSYPSSRLANHSASANGGTLFNRVRAVLGADGIINDWSDKEVTSASVNTDWVVTLPGQYTMEDPICGIYANYSEARGNTCTVLADVDDNELPIYLSNNGQSLLTIYDREEEPLVEEVTGGLSFSPSGADAESTFLNNEVNVLVWSQDAESMGVLESNVATVITAPDAGNNNGWASMSIDPENSDPSIYDVSFLGGQGDAVPVDNDSIKTAVTGSSPVTKSAVSGDTPVLAMAIWERNFGANAAANYGRAVEHSYVVSSGGQPVRGTP